MKSVRKNWHLITAGLLGAIAFLFIYGLEPLRFTGIGWTQHGYGGYDITQHQTGWMFYRNSPWTFPLCKALFLGYPEGTSISFTDSIPLAALFFKILSPVLPDNFQYFGLYTCFCFMMQGVFSCALVHIKTKNKVYSAIGSILFITASCFIERCFRHTALSSHWLILAALLLYFLRREKQNSVTYIQICVLLCTALGIHPYLFAMVFLILTFSETEIFFTEKRHLKAELPFMLCIVVFVLFGYMLGLFGTKVAPARGFGQYSLNLNAVFNPNSVHHDVWSAFLPKKPLFAAQGDGIYYLGLPLLVFTMIVTLLRAVFHPAELFRSLKKYGWFTLLLAGCTIFSVSNVITFGDRVLYQIPLSEKITDLFNIFRSSGRFFFIPYYCIILYALTSLYNFFRKKKFLPIIFCFILCLTQVIEILPGLKDMHAYFETRYDYLPLSQEWDQLAEQYDTARTFDCLTNRSLAFWLAKTGFRTEMMITSAIHMDAYWRQTEPERLRLREALKKGTEPLDLQTIYIISAETGTNRSFSNDSELEIYIESVSASYSGRAELKFLTDWVRDYWVLCPLPGF